MSENVNTISRITVGGTTYELKSNVVPKIVTWEEFKKLKDSNELSPGLKYRIVDYHASVNSNGSAYGLSTIIDSLNFDIIVEALSINVLSEDALVCRSDEDNLIQKFNAWEIKYCLDNDTSRFAWADTENGKGVIYYMKDEYGNSAYYDFKGILFNNSFTFGDNNIDYSSSDSNNEDVCKNNTIGYCFNEEGYPDRINISKGSRNNTIGDNCSNILIGNDSRNNKIGNNCHQLNFTTINNSKIGDNCNSIISDHEINNINILDNNKQLILKTQNEGGTINNVKFLEYKGYQLGTTTVVLNPEETITTVEISNDYDNNYKTSTSPILGIEIPIATTENSGLMSSEDKNLLQKLIDKNFPLIVTLKSNTPTTTSNALNILEGSKSIELSWSLKYEGNTNNEDLSNYMGELKIGDNTEIISDLSISKKVISLDKTTTISLTVNNKVGKTTIYFALPFYSANIPLNKSLEISDLSKISPIPTTLSNLSNQNIVGLIEDYKYIIAVPDNINITGAKDVNTGFGFPLVEDGNIEIEGYQYKLYTSSELAAETNWTIKIS